MEYCFYFKCLLYLKDGLRTRVIYLIRHGRYHIEEDNEDDQRLTELGRKGCVIHKKFYSNEMLAIQRASNAYNRKSASCLHLTFYRVLLFEI